MSSLKAKLGRILKIDPRLMRRMRKIVAPFRRVGLKKEFTLLADNCWGGRLYDKFSLQYLTPTIGLAINAEGFVKFVENLDEYLQKELIPIEKEQKRVNSEWGFYPCMLGDIRIEFRHYRNVNDAINKWNRRKLRIKKENIIVKMSYYGNTNNDVIERFKKIPCKKILFTDKEDLILLRNEYTKVVYIPKESIGSEFVYSDSKLKLKELKRFINQ